MKEIRDRHSWEKVDVARGMAVYDPSEDETIGDTYGHAAGDEALTTLAKCFMRALKHGQKCYRVGGDEFVIICRRNTQNDVVQLIERIRDSIGKTKYSCSIGYSYNANTSRPIDGMLKESDKMMYEEKAHYYQERRHGIEK